MFTRAVIIALLTVAPACSPSSDSPQKLATALPPAEEIIRRAAALCAYQDQFMKIEARVTEADGATKQYIIETHRVRDGERTSSLSQIIEPERGNALLSIEDETGAKNVTYLPGFAKYFEVPSTQEDPSFGLAIQESLVAEHLYSYDTQGTTKLDGDEVYVVEGTLKPDVDSHLRRMVEYFRISDGRPLKTEIFNERGELLRVKRYFDYRQVDGHWTSTRTEIDNIGRKKLITLTVLEARYDRDLPASMFTREHLKKISPGLK
ncbi:MAG: outer membrane lipoprotein-sorting protein [Acidobacteria bacterium]|nr:outer membrane lipoprotein-sorting protein [Acidobacteriota bacterium]